MTKWKTLLTWALTLGFTIIFLAAETIMPAEAGWDPNKEEKELKRADLRWRTAAFLANRAMTIKSTLQKDFRAVANVAAKTTTCHVFGFIGHHCLPCLSRLT
jgi:hypothetical protein